MATTKGSSGEGHGDPRHPNLSTYGARVADKIRELRIKNCWRIDQLCYQLLQVGGEVKPQTLRSYERGKLQNGADLPMNLVPLFGLAFGYKTATAWLPKS